MSSQPPAPTGTLTYDELPNWVHLPSARTKQLDPRTQRAVQARIARLLGEADRAEGAALADVLEQLEELQQFVRSTLATTPTGTPFATLWGELERRIDTTMARVAGTVIDRIGDAAAAGTRLVDELLDVAGAAPLGPSTDDLTSGLVVKVRQLLAEAHQNLKMRTTEQTLQYVTGRQDLAGTLRLVGDGLRGSRVFGAPASRVAKVVRTEMGEAHGLAVDARAMQLNATATPGGYVTLKRWQWSHDPTGGRDAHAMLERKYAPGSSPGPILPHEQYRVGQFSTPYPRGPGLPGVEKINCGCRSVPVLMQLTEDGTGAA